MFLTPDNLPLLLEVRRQLDRVQCCGEMEARMLLRSIDFLDTMTAMLTIERQAPKPHPAD